MPSCTRTPLGKPVTLATTLVTVPVSASMATIEPPSGADSGP